MQPDIATVYASMSTEAREWPGRIISVSGMDGTGKTKAVSTICGFLAKLGLDHVVSRQPSAMIRSWLPFRSALDDAETSAVVLEAIGGLVAWDRLNTQFADIIPALKAGKIIVCERYALDICALSMHRRTPLAVIQNWIAPLLMPDLDIMVDAPAELVFQRLGERKGKLKVEERDAEIIGSIIQSYRTVGHALGCHVIDTSLPLATNQNTIAEVLLQSSIVSTAQARHEPLPFLQSWSVS